MKSKLSGRVLPSLCDFCFNTRSERIIFGSLITTTKLPKTKTSWICTVTSQQKNQGEQYHGNSVFLVILLQNFKEQKRERPGDRNKGKEREFS